MKKMILIFNVLAGISIIAIIWGLSVGKSTGFWEFINPISVTTGILIVLLLLASIYLSNRVGASNPKAWASVGLIMFVLVLLAGGFLMYLIVLGKSMNSTGSGNHPLSPEVEMAKKNQIENILPSLSRDYVFKEENSMSEMFLTVDKKNQEIISVVVDYGDLRVTPVGKIIGKALELAERLSQEGYENQKRYYEYLSQEGKTIYDDYEEKYTSPTLGDKYDFYKDYHLDQYK